GGSFARRRVGAKDFAACREDLGDLNSEIDGHRAGLIHVVAIEKDIVAGRAQMRIVAQKFPHLVQRLAEMAGNVGRRHARPRRGDGPGLYPFDTDDVGHSVSAPNRITQKLPDGSVTLTVLWRWRCGFRSKVNQLLQ